MQKYEDAVARTDKPSPFGMFERSEVAALRAVADAAQAVVDDTTLSQSWGSGFWPLLINALDNLHDLQHTDSQ